MSSDIDSDTYSCPDWPSDTEEPSRSASSDRKASKIRNNNVSEPINIEETSSETRGECQMHPVENSPSRANDTQAAPPADQPRPDHSVKLDIEPQDSEAYQRQLLSLEMQYNHNNKTKANAPPFDLAGSKLRSLNDPDFHPRHAPYKQHTQELPHNTNTKTPDIKPNPPTTKETLNQTFRLLFTTLEILRADPDTNTILASYDLSLPLPIATPTPKGNYTIYQTLKKKATNLAQQAATDLDQTTTELESQARKDADLLYYLAELNSFSMALKKRNSTLKFRARMEREMNKKGSGWDEVEFRVREGERRVSREDAVAVEREVEGILRSVWAVQETLGLRR